MFVPFNVVNDSQTLAAMLNTTERGLRYKEGISQSLEGAATQ